MDQCTHCTARGDMEACKKLDCSWHDLWYTQELLRQIKDLKERIDDMIPRLPANWGMGK